MFITNMILQKQEQTIIPALPAHITVLHLGMASVKFEHKGNKVGAVLISGLAQRKRILL